MCKHSPAAKANTASSPALLSTRGASGAPPAPCRPLLLLLGAICVPPGAVPCAPSCFGGSLPCGGRSPGQQSCVWGHRAGGCRPPAALCASPWPLAHPISPRTSGHQPTPAAAKTPHTALSEPGAAQPQHPGDSVTSVVEICAPRHGDTTQEPKHPPTKPQDAARGHCAGLALSCAAMELCTCLFLPARGLQPFPGTPEERTAPFSQETLKKNMLCARGTCPQLFPGQPSPPCWELSTERSGSAPRAAPLRKAPGTKHHQVTDRRDSGV